MIFQDNCRQLSKNLGVLSHSCCSKWDVITVIGIFFFFNRKDSGRVLHTLEIWKRKLEVRKWTMTKNAKPIQKNKNIGGLLKTPGLVESRMKQLLLDIGQWSEIYVQIKVIYAHLLHKGSLFIANKWAHLMDLISIQIFNVF